MTDRVPTDQIEQVVGASRHASRHLGRAVSRESRVYILHSADCLATIPDLRSCDYSLALDDGIDLSQWLEDRTVLLSIDEASGRLIGESIWVGEVHVVDGWS